jgi:uncharacterized membrane protein (UPF0127 family)
MEFSIFLLKCTINYNLTKTNAVGRTMIFASASTDSQYVLETVAGFISRHNVSVGTDVDFELVR